MNWTPARIKQLRKSLGLNQQKFAEMLGLHQPMVSALENGNHEPWPVLGKLLDCIYQTHEREKVKA